jgi:Ca2+-binding EF-hand superfamily protein
MDPMSEFDIRDSFDAMDKEKVGRISMDSFKIVYLGLGYPKSGFEDLSEQVLRIQDNIDDGLSLKTVKTVLSKVCAISRSPYFRTHSTF